MASGILGLGADFKGSYYERIEGFSGSTREWRTWEKPRGYSWFQFLVVGAGGGGGSGFPSATITARGGGSGGSSGAQTYLLIPSTMLPEVLYLTAGLGGAGGASSTSVGNVGIAGQGSVVATRPVSAAFYTLIFANGGTVGTAATAAAAGGTPGAVAAMTKAGALMCGSGHVDWLAGLPGAAGGGINGAGPAIAWPTTGLLVAAGAGGGGGTSAGGDQTAPASQTAGNIILPTRVAGTAGAPGNPGQSGFQVRDSLVGFPLSMGGAGGGASSNATDQGGRGGNGGPGSGGGGGGAGGTTGGGGAGGNGGNGWIEIWGF